MSFDFPSNSQIINGGNYASPAWMQWFARVHGLVNGMQQSGGTVGRPAKLVWIGLRFFDTDLGKPVYVKSVNPIVWVDAAGGVV